MKDVKTVAAYIASQPPRTRKALKQLRAAIKAAAPGITERISYRIALLELDRRALLYIAGFREHVSVYPVTAAMVARCGPELEPYRHGKGTLRFSLDAPIPTALIARLARVRVIELRSKAEAATTKRRTKSRAGAARQRKLS